VIHLLANVQQKTIEPFIKDTIIPGTCVYTDEYSIYVRLQSWGYSHKHVNHGRGEFARDEDGDGFCEVHVNTMEGFWSLLRSWLRPHRGISQEKLPLYLGFFERSYWIPGSYAPALSEKRHSFLRLLKNKGFKEESMTKVELYALGISTTLESSTSLLENLIRALLMFNGLRSRHGQ
jgi:transposase